MCEYPQLHAIVHNRSKNLTACRTRCQGCMQDGRTCLPGLESKNAHVFFSNQAMAEQCPQWQLHRLRLARYVNNQLMRASTTARPQNDRSLFSNAVKVGSRRSRQALHTRTKRASAIGIPVRGGARNAQRQDTGKLALYSAGITWRR